MLLLVLSGLAWMTQILSLLKFLIQYGVDLWAFTGLTILTLPFVISVIIPFVLFITVMFIYNRMISDREVTVMASAGLSPIQLAWPAIKLAGILAALHLVLNIWIVPAAQVKFDNTQWEMRYGLAHLRIQESAFIQMTRGLVVFVEKVSGFDMSGIMLYDGREAKSSMIISADKGKMVHTPRGLSMVMTTGSIQYRADTFIIGTFDSFDMDMNVADKGADNRFRARRVPTLELMHATRDVQNINAKEYKGIIAELVTRFLGPFMGIILVLIGMVFLLKSSLLRRGGFNLAAPFAVVGMGAAQTAFMTLSNMIDSVAGLFLLFALQAVAIIGLIFVLKGIRRK